MVLERSELSIGRRYLSVGSGALVVRALLLFGCVFFFGCASESDGTIDLPLLNICNGKADSDGDGVCDDVENQFGLDPFNSDSDLDGFLDGSDVAPLGASGGSFGSSSNGLLTLASLVAFSLVADTLDSMTLDNVVGLFDIFGGDEEEEGDSTEQPASSTPEICQQGLDNTSSDAAIYSCYSKTKLTVDANSSYLRFVEINSNRWYMIFFVNASFDALTWKVAFISQVTFDFTTAGGSWTLPSTGAKAFTRYGFDSVNIDRHKALNSSQVEDLLAKLETNAETVDVSGTDGFFIKLGNKVAREIDDLSQGFESLPTKPETHFLDFSKQDLPIEAQAALFFEQVAAGSGVTVVNPFGSILGSINPNLLIIVSSGFQSNWNKSTPTSTGGTLLAPWVGMWQRQ